MNYGTSWSTKYGPAGPLVLGMPPEHPQTVEEEDCSRYIKRCRDLENLIEALWDSAMIPEELHQKIMNTLYQRS
ncbi:MAG: hypothetical protein OQK78_08335 [Gammaproteobacteria bacterium]|nr:hypothetical protein [Gammaproteobacteria bacterium]